MLKFVKNAFRTYFEVILLLNLMVCTMAGGAIGSKIGVTYGSAGGGLIIGFIIGMLLNIICGGLTAIFLNIDENIEKLVKGQNLSSNYGKKEVANNTTTAIPYGVTVIERSAFGNKQLTCITIPNSVTTIEEYAFAFNQLTNIIFPSSVTVIRQGAFTGNPLTCIVIGANVDIIEDQTPSFDNNFTLHYNRNGRKAGIYSLQNGVWIKQPSTTKQSNS